MNDIRNIRESEQEPHWLRLAGALRAEADPATLARVRARLAARASGPAWVRWLSRPAAVAASAVMLVASAMAGGAMLSATGVRAEDETPVVTSLLGDDGSYGLPLERDEASAATTPDSGGSTR